MKSPRLRKVYEESAAALRRKPRVSFVYLLLRFLVILTIITQFFNRNYENVFLGLGEVKQDDISTLWAKRVIGNDG